MLWSYCGGRMWKISIGGRTIYNLAWKQRCPSELHGDGMTLHFQILMLMVFLLIFFVNISLITVSLVSYHWGSTKLVITFHLQPRASTCLTGHSDNICLVFQEWWRWRTLKQWKRELYLNTLQRYKSTVLTLMLGKKNIHVEEYKSTFLLKNKPRDLFSRKLVGTFSL